MTTSLSKTPYCKMNTIMLQICSQAAAAAALNRAQLTCHIRHLPMPSKGPLRLYLHSSHLFITLQLLRMQRASRSNGRPFATANHIPAAPASSTSTSTTALALLIMLCCCVIQCGSGFGCSPALVLLLEAASAAARAPLHALLLLLLLSMVPPVASSSTSCCRLNNVSGPLKRPCRINKMRSRQ